MRDYTQYAHGFGGMNADTPIHPSCQTKSSLAPATCYADAVVDIEIIHAKVEKLRLSLLNVDEIETPLWEAQRKLSAARTEMLARQHPHNAELSHGGDKKL